MNNLYQWRAAIPLAGQIILNPTWYKIIMCNYDYFVYKKRVNVDHYVLKTGII
jgi:hypothetical protein